MLRMLTYASLRAGPFNVKSEDYDYAKLRELRSMQTLVLYHIIGNPAGLQARYFVEPRPVPTALGEVGSGDEDLIISQSGGKACTPHISQCDEIYLNPLPYNSTAVPDLFPLPQQEIQDGKFERGCSIAECCSSGPCSCNLPLRQWLSLLKAPFATT